MQSKARWVMAAIVLSALGCSTRSTLVPIDGSAKPDAPSGADLRAADAAEVAADSAVPADGALAASPEVHADVASPEVAADHPCSRCDAPASDIDFAGDATDGPSRDMATEGTPPEVALSEAGTPDAGADLIFSSLDGAAVGLDGALAAFCTGNLTRMIVNGIQSSPAPTGRMLALDCCDAGEVILNTATFLHPILVGWRAQAGAASRIPATIDLANPPAGWSVQVLVGCQSSATSCNPQPDGFRTGLQGTLQVARVSSGYDMSVCLHVEEPAGSPHPIVHTLDLFVPHVTLD